MVKAQEVAEAGVPGAACSSAASAESERWLAGDSVAGRWGGRA